MTESDRIEDHVKNQVKERYQNTFSKYSHSRMVHNRIELLITSMESVECGFTPIRTLFSQPREMDYLMLVLLRNRYIDIYTHLALTLLSRAGERYKGTFPNIYQAI